MNQCQFLLFILILKLIFTFELKILKFYFYLKLSFKLAVFNLEFRATESLKLAIVIKVKNFSNNKLNHIDN